MVMVTLRGSSTAMARGACSFSTSRTHASSRCGSIVAWATVTPTCGTHRTGYHHPGVLGEVAAPRPTLPHGAYPGAEVVDGLGGEASAAQGGQGEEPRVVPVPENALGSPPNAPRASPTPPAGPAHTSQRPSPPGG